MAAHIGSVLMAERDVEDDAQSTAFLRRGNECRTFAQHLAERRAELGMENGGGVLELTPFANRGSLAITFHPIASDAQCGDGALGQQAAQLLSDIDKECQVLLKNACVRIFDDGHSRCTAGGRIDRPSLLGQRLIHKDHNLPDPALHRSPSSPFTSLARSPPTRSCTRAPVVMTRATTISSERGASAIPTSIASK